MNLTKAAIWVIVLIASFSVGIAYAIDVSGVLYQANVDIINLGFDRTNGRSAQEISGASLIDDGFVEADYLNGVINEGTSLINNMPPNNRIVDEGVVLDDGGSFTEYTTEAQDATELDIALLPIIPANGDALYVGCDNPCRILTFDIGQEAITDGGWDIGWEYYNGTAFTDVANVDDRTNDFRLAGLRTVSWDMPVDMATTTVTGSSVDAFWVRGVTQSVTGSATQQAIGNQGWYENGQHWMWFDSLDINEQKKYQLSIGGDDLVTRHSVFPGAAGVVTPDNATMELTDDFGLHFEGSVSFAVTGSATQCLVCKGDALRLTVTGPDEVTLAVSGSGTTTLTVSGIPEATQGVSGAGHTIDVLSDGTDVELVVQGVGSSSGTAQDITDTADSWEFATNNSATFFNQIFMLPDDASLGQLSLFDSEAEWDSGATFSDTLSTAGQPTAPFKETYFINVYDDPDSDSCDDGHWQEGDSGFFACEAPGDATFLLAGFDAGADDETNAFFRFDNVAVASANRNDVTSVVITVTARDADACASTVVRIQAVAEDDPAAPVSFADAEGRTLTTAFVDWTIPTFVSDTRYESPELITIFDEIFARAGWNSGNAIVIYFSELSSTDPCTRTFYDVENDGTAPWLELVRSTDPATPTALTADFLELDNTQLPIPDWEGTDCEAYTGIVAGLPNSLFDLRSLDNRQGINNSITCTQNLAAIAGEVWSASVYYDCPLTACRLRLRWLDVSLVQIGAEILSAQCGNNFARWDLCEINGETAPATTAWLQMRVIPGNTPNSHDYADGALACVCASAPTYPSALNVVLNPSFELTYNTPGTWTSPAIGLIVDDVASTVIAWDEFEFGQATTSTVLVESRLDGGAWTAQTSGSSIAGINLGDNVNGSILELRVTLTGDQEFSPGVSLLSAFVGQDPGLGDTNVFYELRSTPAVLLTDLSPNGNDGVMSYPIMPVGLISSITPLESTRLILRQQEAVGAPDFASPVTGSATDNNLFGEDTGSFLPLGGLFAAAAASGGLPVRFFWILIIMIFGIMAGALAVKVFKSVLMASVILGLCLVVAAWIGDGLIPGWSVLVGFILMAALNMLRPRLPI